MQLPYYKVMVEMDNWEVRYLGVHRMLPTGESPWDLVDRVVRQFVDNMDAVGSMAGVREDMPGYCHVQDDSSAREYLYHTEADDYAL